MGSSLLGVGEFFAAAPVAVFFDEAAGLGEFGLVVEQAGTVEVDVGEVERHRAALGDLLRFVEEAGGGVGIAGEVVVPGGGEEGEREVMGCAGLAEAAEGGGEMGMGKVGTQVARGIERGAVEVDAGEGEVVEGVVEETWVIGKYFSPYSLRFQRAALGFGEADSGLFPQFFQRAPEATMPLPRARSAEARSRSQ